MGCQKFLRFLDKALRKAGIDPATTDWTDNDPEFLLLYKQSTGVDVQLVRIYQEKGTQLSEWPDIKKQQKSMRAALEHYMLRALKMVGNEHQAANKILDTARLLSRIARVKVFSRGDIKVIVI